MKTVEYTHFKMSEKALQLFYKNKGKHRPQALCFNGSAHIELTPLMLKVNCPECWKKIKGNTLEAWLACNF